MKKTQEEIEQQFIFKIKKKKVNDLEISAHWNRILSCIKPPNKGDLKQWSVNIIINDSYN